MQAGVWRRGKLPLGLNLGLGLGLGLGLRLVLGLSLCFSAWAGGQAEEHLRTSVRVLLSSSIAHRAPPVPQFFDQESRERYWQWFRVMERRLLSKKSFPTSTALHEFLQTVWYESRRAGLDADLVLGLVQVESNFRKYAISTAGARGLMQVMPFWAKLIGDGDDRRLFNLQTNLRFGCVILRHYLDLEGGDLFLALGRYNGSRGQSAYPSAVLAARQQFTWTPMLAANSHEGS
jgi:soluble lytic murein transglycosylase-like protein